MYKRRHMDYIAIDFDGTIVNHEYPQLGSPVPGAIDWMHKFMENNIHIILYTMRSGKYLDEAVEYLEDNGIVLFGKNRNKNQYSWTKSPKIYANAYIDDAAVGCPLIYVEGQRPYVDWAVAGPEALKRFGIKV